ncbi:hypothetical protein [[Clostridium] colinum]|uniref:hypothetical protein n=1 Tax=[Clostridium] colinum TaxID=36835 RepID=UPI0020251AAD|nr:hypothetical protein [[Clostridium] colinum]
MKKKLFLLISGFTLCFTSNAYASRYNYNDSFGLYQGEVIPLNVHDLPLESKIHEVHPYPYPAGTHHVDYKVYNTNEENDNSFAYSIQFKPKAYFRKSNQLKIKSLSGIDPDSIKIIQGGHVGKDKTVISPPEILYENGKLTELGEKFLEVEVSNKTNGSNENEIKTIDIKIKDFFTSVFLNRDNMSWANVSEDKLYVIFKTKFNHNNKFFDSVHIQAKTINFDDRQEIDIDKSRQN